jgi:RNA polymerase sigma-70 factor (ECF subfamily)
MPKVYAELRALARRFMTGERRDHTLQPTELVHEVYLRLVGQTEVEWKSRAHFYAIAAQAMRRTLVDHARARKRMKRGAGNVPLDDGISIAGQPPIDLLELDEALTELAKADPRKAKVVDFVLFGGLTAEETAAILQVSSRTVWRDWRYARAWLLQRLSHGRTAS